MSDARLPKTDSFWLSCGQHSKSRGCVNGKVSRSNPPQLPTKSVRSPGLRLETPLISTDFCCAFDSFRGVSSRMAAWKGSGVRLGQARLQESCDQLAAFLAQPLQLLAIAHQKAREGHQANQRCQTNLAKNPDAGARPVVGKIVMQRRSTSSANYRQQGEQGEHRCEALHTSPVTLNPCNALLHFAAFITAVMTNGVPQKRRVSFVLAYNG